MIVSDLQSHVERLLEEVQEQAQRRRLVTYLRRYISPATALWLLRENRLAALIDQRTLDKVTVFFVDIRDFVKTVEEIERHNGDLALVRSMLLDFANAVTQVIFKHEGISGEFAGDRIMAVFGVPTPRPDDAARALKAAVELYAAFADLHDQWQQKKYELPELCIGVGLHTGGPVLVGDLGSKWRRELSLFGTTANIASRLEELTKREDACRGEGLNIIVSEATYNETKSIADFGEPVQRTLRGVSTPILTRQVTRLKPGIELTETPQDRERRNVERKQIEEVAEWIEGASQREQSMRVSQSLSQIGEAFSLLGPEEVLDEVIEQGQRMLGAKRVSLTLIDKDTEELVFRKVVEDSPSKPLIGKRMPMSAGWVGRVVTSGEPLILFDMLQEDQEKRHFNSFDDLTQLVPRSMLCAPLRTRGETIGAIQVTDEQPNRFTREDLNVLIFIAAQAAVAIENARLSSELNRMGEAIVSSLDRDTILRTVMSSTQRLLRADTASLLLLDGQELEFVIVSPPSSAKELLGVRMPSDKGYVGQVVTTGTPILESDILKDRAEIHYDKFDEPTGVVPRSMVCVPLKTRGQIIGAIQVIDNKPGRFVDEDLQTLTFIANQASIAVENAEQLTRLEQAQQKLVAVETRARLGDIAGKLVHELNNKLGAVRVFAQDILDDTGTSKDSKIYAQDILKSVSTSLQELKELRLVLKKPETEPQEVDLTAVLNRAIVGFKRERVLVGGPPLELEQLLTDERFPILGEEREIEYVVRNLLDNAFDAIEAKREHYPAMRGHIRLESKRGGERPRVSVWVSDNGIGIPEAVRDRIFDPEFTTKPEGKGMGYGLSWAQLYVRGLGGEIELESSVNIAEPESSVKGSGTTFVIRLPLSQNRVNERSRA